MKNLRRAKLHETTRGEIKEIAWQQIAAAGPEAISMSAIARSMGLTTPALYRYFKDRDALIAALTFDAYDTFELALEAAVANTHDTIYAERFRSICIAYHDWAVKYPARYQLIFGSHIAGGNVPAEAAPLADLSFIILLDTIGQADRERQLHFPEEQVSLSAGLLEQLEQLEKRGQDYPPRVLYLAIIVWSEIHGLTSLELMGHLPHLLGGSTEALFLNEVDRILRWIGLNSTSSGGNQ